ncbi:uncharacterized protein METZ01_LOCUS400956, partial [marine metagenome]
MSKAKDVPGGLARPCVGLENLLERRLPNQLVAIHHLPNGVTNAGKRRLLVAEGINRDLVSGVEHGRQRAGYLAGTARLAKRWELGQVRRLEIEPAKRSQVGLHALTRGPAWAGERVLDRQAHVGRGELREDRAVDELD